MRVSSVLDCCLLKVPFNPSCSRELHSTTSALCRCILVRGSWWVRTWTEKNTKCSHVISTFFIGFWAISKRPDTLSYYLLWRKKCFSKSIKSFIFAIYTSPHASLFSELLLCSWKYQKARSGNIFKHLKNLDQKKYQLGVKRTMQLLRRNSMLFKLSEVFCRSSLF